ncbi:MAG TPA: DNA adenine methylase [Aquabacterium sp.]|nr:DNA adenine methylase [Aquabacterium sp.]
MSAAAEIRRPALRYHGGKWRLAPWIISHFPSHRVYVEPYGGAASVLLRKPRGKAEIYNDLDGEVVNLFQVVRDRGAELVAAIELTPYARDEFYLSFIHSDDPLERARRLVLRSFAGYGGNLTKPNRDGTPQRTGFRTYCGTGRGRSTCGDWRALPAEVRKIIERMQGVCIEHRDALRVMHDHDSPSTLHYVDPPYVHATRGMDSGGSHRGYRFEMTDDQHRELAHVLRSLKGMVVLSGYQSDLYTQLYSGWVRLDHRSHADGARPRIESIWLNPASAEARPQQSLLDSIERGQGT